jgi:hypothetical protein
MSDHDAFADRGHALEEEYFRKKNRELVEKMRQAAAAESVRADMQRTTGLSDPAVLQELQEIGFTPDTVSLLPLVPVIEVAWAEGGITAAERDLIVKLARSRGIEDPSPASQQLNQWMASRPDSVVFERAGHLIAAMLDSGSDEARRGLTADELVAYCEKIAGASGGIFGTGLRSITSEERALLTRIASDLKTRQA